MSKMPALSAVESIGRFRGVMPWCAPVAEIQVIVYLYQLLEPLELEDACSIFNDPTGYELCCVADRTLLILVKDYAVERYDVRMTREIHSEVHLVPRPEEKLDKEVTLEGDSLPVRKKTRLTTGLEQRHRPLPKVRP